MTFEIQACRPPAFTMTIRARGLLCRVQGSGFRVTGLDIVAASLLAGPLGLHAITPAAANHAIFNHKVMVGKDAPVVGSPNLKALEMHVFLVDRNDIPPALPAAAAAAAVATGTDTQGKQRLPQVLYVRI